MLPVDLNWKSSHLIERASINWLLCALRSPINHTINIYYFLLILHVFLRALIMMVLVIVHVSVATH